MSNKDRTNISMTVRFSDLDSGWEPEDVDVYVPFEVFMAALRDYFSARTVNLDGTDSAIWNALMDIRADVDGLEDDEEFINLCKKHYAGTRYEADDRAYWIEEHEAAKGLGD